MALEKRDRELLLKISEQLGSLKTAQETLKAAHDDSSKRIAELEQIMVESDNTHEVEFNGRTLTYEVDFSMPVDISDFTQRLKSLLIAYGVENGEIRIK